MISFILEIQIPLLLFFITQFFSYGVLLCSLKKEFFEKETSYGIKKLNQSVRNARKSNI